MPLVGIQDGVSYAAYEFVATLAAGDGFEKLVDCELLVLLNTHGITR